MSPKEPTTRDIFCMAYHAMMRRARRGDRPLISDLTVIGEPWGRRWARHKDLYLKTVKTYEEPEVTVPACAMGVILILSLPHSLTFPGTIVNLGLYAGLTAQESAGLIILSDYGAPWDGIANAMHTYRTHGGNLTGPQMKGDVIRRLVKCGIKEVDVGFGPLDLVEEAKAYSLLPLPHPATLLLPVPKPVAAVAKQKEPLAA